MWKGGALWMRRHAMHVLFEGVCVNYRNPGPRRGEPRVGSAPDVAFPLDPAQNSGRLSNSVFYNDFGTFCRKMITFSAKIAFGRSPDSEAAPDKVLELKMA